jgi:putative FmdB family regulatory protein
VPVYDYVCSACGRVTEVIHGINAEGPRFCPACGAEGTLRKGFSTPAVHFKGSGWAKKDRASSATRAASARSGGDAKVESGSTGSSDESGGSTAAAGTDSSSSSTSSPKDGSTTTSDKASESGGSKKAGPVERASSRSKPSSADGSRGGD